jgi:hypothetical protein
MIRAAARLTAILGLALLVTACDKCGNVELNLPGGGTYKSCTDVKPQG